MKGIILLFPRITYWCVWWRWYVAAVFTLYTKYVDTKFWKYSLQIAFQLLQYVVQFRAVQTPQRGSLFDVVIKYSWDIKETRNNARLASAHLAYVVVVCGHFGSSSRSRNISTVWRGHLTFILPVRDADSAKGEDLQKGSCPPQKRTWTGLALDWASEGPPPLGLPLQRPAYYW